MSHSTPSGVDSHPISCSAMGDNLTAALSYGQMFAYPFSSGTRTSTFCGNFFSFFFQGIRMLSSSQVIHKTENFSLLFKKAYEIFINTGPLALQFYVSLYINLLFIFAISCVTVVSNDTFRYWVPTVPAAPFI